MRPGWDVGLPYPVRDAVRRWRGMLGMMLGVGIALGMGMTMLAVSNGSVDIYTADYRKSGADLYVVTQGGTLIAVLPSDTPGTIKNARHVLGLIRSFPDVATALGIITWPMERVGEGPRRRDQPTELITTVGVDGDPTTVPNALLLEQGRWFRRTDEIVLGAKLSREKSVGIGGSLRLNGRDFEVVGIGRLRGIGFSSDSMAYMDRQSLRQRAEIGDVVNAIAVDTGQPERTRQRIAEMGSFAVSSPDDLVKQAENVNATALVLRWIMISLTMTIAALFVSNMLARSVAERRLEFATLRAIGIPTRTILMTVAAQAVMISIAAGMVGIGVSLALGGLINGWVAPAYGIESLYSLDARVFAAVFALGLGLGVVSGLLPARQATRVDPVLVLREA